MNCTNTAEIAYNKIKANINRFQNSTPEEKT